MLLPRKVEPQTREELVDSLREFQGLEISTPEKDDEKDHGGVLGKMFETYMAASGGNSSDPDLRKLKCELKTKLFLPHAVIDAKWLELMNISPDKDNSPNNDLESLKKHLFDEYKWEKDTFSMNLTVAQPNGRGFFLTVDTHKGTIALSFDPEYATNPKVQKWVQGKKKDSFVLWNSAKLDEDLRTKFPNLALGVATQGRSPNTFLFHTIYLCEELNDPVLSRLLFREGRVKKRLLVKLKMTTATSWKWELHARIGELRECYKSFLSIIEDSTVTRESKDKSSAMYKLAPVGDWRSDDESGGKAEDKLEEAKRAVVGVLVEGKLKDGVLEDSVLVLEEDKPKDRVLLDEVPVGYILVNSLPVVGMQIGVQIGQVIKDSKQVDDRVRVRVGGVQQEVKNMVQGIKNIQAARDAQIVLKEVESITKNIQGVQKKAREARECADSIQQYENIAPRRTEEARRWAGSAEYAAEDTQHIKIALDALVRVIHFSQDALVKVKSILSIEEAKEQADFVRIWAEEAEKFTQKMQIQISPSERFLDGIPVQVMLTQIVETAQGYLRTIQALLAVLDERAKAVQEAKDALDYVPLVEQVVRETLAMLSPKAVQGRATHIKSMVQDAQNHTMRAKEYMKAAKYYEKKVKEMSEIQGKSGKEAEA